MRSLQAFIQPTRNVPVSSTMIEFPQNQENNEIKEEGEKEDSRSQSLVPVGGGPTSEEAEELLVEGDDGGPVDHHQENVDDVKEEGEEDVHNEAGVQQQEDIVSHGDTTNGDIDEGSCEEPTEIAVALPAQPPKKKGTKVKNIAKVGFIVYHPQPPFSEGGEPPVIMYNDLEDPEPHRSRTINIHTPYPIQHRKVSQYPDGREIVGDVIRFEDAALLEGFVPSGHHLLGLLRFRNYISVYNVISAMFSGSEEFIQLLADKNNEVANTFIRILREEKGKARLRVKYIKVHIRVLHRELEFEAYENCPDTQKTLMIALLAHGFNQ